MIMANLEQLDLMACSQILYAFYRVAIEIEYLGLTLVESKKICEQIVKLLQEVKEINFLNNKAITGILVFTREFLYDDIYLLSAIVDVKK
jgi:hypothetical protein